VSGYDSESVTKGGVSTSNGSSWSWTRSGTVWDDGRNNWSESWSKSSWKDGKYAPNESESKTGGFDPKKTGPQVNDVPKFGEAPRLNKGPKQEVPIDFQKPPKPSDDIWAPTFILIKEPQFKQVFGSSGSDSPSGGSGNDDLANNPSGGSGGGGSSPNQDKIQKFLRELRKVMAQGKQAVIDFLKGFIYHCLINGVGILKDVADLLYPPGAKSHAEIGAYYRNNLSFQAGRAIANGLTFLAGLLGIALIVLSIGASGGSTLVAAPAQVAALVATGNMTVASARDMLNVLGQVFQMTSAGTNGSSGSSGTGSPGGESTPNFTPAQQSRINKIDEIAHNWAARKTLSGEILDAPHRNKIREGVQGLRKAREALQNTLKNPNLDPVTKVAIQSRINTATQLIERAEQLIGPIP
jgi:hypothetical protein